MKRALLAVIPTSNAASSAFSTCKAEPPATTPSGNSTASLFVPGHVGDYYFQVQGNTLFSDQVMFEAAGAKPFSTVPAVGLAESKR